MTFTTGVVLTSLIAATPLVITVGAAVLSRDKQRRDDARQVLRILRPGRSLHRRTRRSRRSNGAE
jgi:hypothetical protein